MGESSRALSALVYEATGGTGAPVAAELIRLGWQVRVVDRDVGALLEAPADVWVVNLASLPSDPADTLRPLSELRLAVPLLVVADPRHLAPARELLDGLHDAWPAPVYPLVRPYTTDELELHVRWLAADPVHGPVRAAVYEVGALRVDMGKRKVWFRGEPVRMTPTEFRALAALAAAGGDVVSADGLLEAIHGPDSGYVAATLKPHLCRIRQHLQGLGAGKGCIAAARGEGYRLVAEALSPS